MVVRRNLQLIEKQDKVNLWQVQSTKNNCQMKVPAAYVPINIWAEQRKLNPLKVARLAAEGRIVLTGKLPGVMKVGYHRFIHLNANIKYAKD